MKRTSEIYGVIKNERKRNFKVFYLLSAEFNKQFVKS